MDAMGKWFLVNHYIAKWIEKRNGIADYYELGAAVKLHFDMDSDTAEACVRDYFNLKRQEIPHL